LCVRKGRVGRRNPPADSLFATDVARVRDIGVARADIRDRSLAHPMIGEVINIVDTHSYCREIASIRSINDFCSDFGFPELTIFPVPIVGCR